MDRRKSIELLNRAVADALAAVHQQMLHVERLAERILFLKGEVAMAASGPVQKLTDPAAMLARGVEMEDGSVRDYNASAAECSAQSDAGSKQLLDALIVDEERHYDQYEKQLDNIKRFGPSHLALQSFGGGAASAPPASDAGGGL
jgi:bacterioferritin